MQTMAVLMHKHGIQTTELTEQDLENIPEQLGVRIMNMGKSVRITIMPLEEGEETAFMSGSH